MSRDYECYPLYPANLKRNGLSSLCVSVCCPEAPRGSTTNGLLLLSAPLSPLASLSLPPPPSPLHPPPLHPSFPVITSRLPLNPIILLSRHALHLATNSTDDAAVHHVRTSTTCEQSPAPAHSRFKKQCYCKYCSQVKVAQSSNSCLDKKDRRYACTAVLSACFVYFRVS